MNSTTNYVPVLQKQIWISKSKKLKISDLVTITPELPTDNSAHLCPIEQG